VDLITVASILIREMGNGPQDTVCGNKVSQMDTGYGTVRSDGI